MTYDISYGGETSSLSMLNYEIDSSEDRSHLVFSSAQFVWTVLLKIQHVQLCLSYSAILFMS